MGTSDKINGRTPEEIKKGLECCPLCNKSCPYHKEKDCYEKLHYDAFAYIQQFETGIDRIYKQVDAIRGSLGKIQQLKSERDQYKRERDAAVEGLRSSCWHCIHFERGKLLLEKEICMNCAHNFKNESLGDHWQWRGVEVE